MRAIPPVDGRHNASAPTSAGDLERVATRAYLYAASNNYFGAVADDDPVGCDGPHADGEAAAPLIAAKTP